MCVTNIYVDRYPDGREVEFRKLNLCQYGQPGRPCPTHSTLENPVRKIAVGEPTTQYIMTQTIFPSTPPRSTAGSHHRHHSGGSSNRHHSVSSASEDGHRHRHKSVKPTRTHRKERIIIVDAPPTPRTPPQNFQQTFTAPSSPNPQFYTAPRSRPIIVDERTIRPQRQSSLPRVIPTPISIPERSRPIPIPQRSPRTTWDTPSSSHTSFDLRAEREREEAQRQRRLQRQAELTAQETLRARQDAAARRIAEQDAEIRRRPAVPIVPRQQRPAYIRPVVDNSQAISNMMGGLSINTGTADVARRRVSTRVEAEEAEALRQRLRERQMPRRRFSVGPGHRRSRVVYDDGVYRWE